MLTAKEIENKIIGEDGLLDIRLVDLQYSLLQHTVMMEFQDDGVNDGEHRIIFKDCFNAHINIWLEGAQGSIPQTPGDSDFFVHDAVIEEVTLEGVQLYDCKFTIPMMDCHIVCKSITFENQNKRQIGSF